MNPFIISKVLNEGIILTGKIPFHDFLFVRQMIITIGDLHRPRKEITSYSKMK